MRLSVCVWVCVKSGDKLCCQQSPPWLRLPSLSTSDRQCATFLNHSTRDTHRGSGRRTVAVGQKEGYSTVKLNPDNKLFWQLHLQSMCQPTAHAHTAYIHKHTSHRHSLFFAAISRTRCLLSCLSQKIHEHVFCWIDCWLMHTHTYLIKATVCVCVCACL